MSEQNIGGVRVWVNDKPVQGHPEIKDCKIVPLPPDAKDARIAQLERELAEAKGSYMQACSLADAARHRADAATRRAEEAEGAVLVLYDNIRMALTAMERCGLIAVAAGIRRDIVTEPCLSVIASSQLARAATVRKEGT